MTTFEFRAYDENGGLRSGEVTAETVANAIYKVKSMGLIPVTVKLASREVQTTLPKLLSLSRNTLSLDERLQYLKSIAAMLESGLTVADGHRFLAAGNASDRLLNVARLVVLNLSQGLPYAKSLTAAQTGFELFEIAALANAESTGDMLPAIRQLQEYTESKRELRGKLLAAAVYPAILLVTSILSLAVIMSVLLPSVLPLFEGRESDIPKLLAGLAWVQNAFIRFGWVIAAAAAGLVFSTAGVWRSAAGVRMRESLLLRLSVPRQMECARVTGSMAMLLASGHTLQSAMGIAKSAAQFSKTLRELADAEDAVVEGEKFSSAVSKVSIFDAAQRNMLDVGELSNQLQQMLQHIERTSRDSAQEKIERYVSLLTPIATLLMGGLIGGLMMTVMQAILQIDGVVR